MRGEIYELPAPSNTRGHEQNGNRYAIVVQSSDLPLSTWVVCPTSTSARPTSFRPRVEIGNVSTLVLTEQITAVDPQRLGRLVGYVSNGEMRAIDQALCVVLGLD